MITNEKAAGVLDTPQAAQDSKRTDILGRQAIERKEFETLRARFARCGYALQRVFRADDGRVTFHVVRDVQTRVFDHLHALRAFLAVLEGWRA